MTAWAGFSPSLADYERWAAEDIAALRTQIPTHPPLDLCKVDECAVCGVRDCPLGADEHYWHDGCPACWGMGKAIVAWGESMRRAAGL